MAAALKIPRSDHADQPVPQIGKVKPTDRIECAGVFRGRELTRKDRKLPSGLEPIDRLLDGGIVRGRVSELIGPTGAGKTSLAMAFAAQATRLEAAAWIETGANLDPASMLAAGIEPSRMLWVACWNSTHDSHQRIIPTYTSFETQLADLPARSARERASLAPWSGGGNRNDDNAVFGGVRRRQLPVASLKAAEWILAAGGFGLVVIDFASEMRFIPASVALRLARAAEQSGAAVIVMAERRVCGTFAVLSLGLSRVRSRFVRMRTDAPATFDGQVIEARVMRNKLGGTGASALWRAVADPYLNANLETSSRFVQGNRDAHQALDRPAHYAIAGDAG